MRGTGRLAGVAIGLCLFGATLAATLAGVAGPAAAEDLSPTGDRAMAQIAGCAASADHLLVSIVVDESGSLRETDPTDQRVNGINSAIDVLADLRAGANGKLDVEANLGLFAEGYTPLVSWQGLDALHAAHLKAVSSAELPNRNRGDYTDYRAALTGARSTLDTRESQLTGASCKVILWFTDGALDVRGDEGPALAELCAANGIADGVRAAHISVIALALFHEPSSVTAAQRERLRSVAEGSGAGATCGRTPVRSDAAVGAYLRADNASALRRVFAGVGALIGGGSQSWSVQCPSNKCVNGVAKFAVDRGIAGFQIIVDSADDTARIAISGPDGRAIPLAAGTSAVPGGTLKVSARAGLTTATVAFAKADGAQVGPWTVTSRDKAGKPSPVAVDLYYFWGARLAIAAPTGVLIGETSPVTVTATVAGLTVSPDWYQAMDVQLRAGTAKVPLAVGDGGVLDGVVTLPRDGAPTELTMSATATATSTPSGIPLAPVLASVVLPTRLPPTYPTLTPTALVLPRITTADGASGVLRLHGTARGTTTACLAGGDVFGPKQAGHLELAPDATCVKVAKGRVQDWTFTLTPKALADGQISGHLKVVLTGETAGDKVSVRVPVTSSMTRPVDEPLRWALVAACVALALIVPLALLFIGNWWIGRFRLTELTRVASIPVTLTAAGIESRRSGSSVLIEPDDFQPVGLGTVRRRAFSAGGVRFAHSLPLWPLGEPTAHATAEGGGVVVSGTGQYTGARGVRAPVLTALEQCWVLLVEPGDAGSEVRGHLVFVNDERPGLGLREIIESRAEKLLRFTGWEAVRAKVATARAERTAAEAGPRGLVPSKPESAPGPVARVPAEKPPPPSSLLDDAAAAPVAPPRTDWSLPNPEAPPRGGRPTGPPSPNVNKPIRASDDELPPPPPLTF